MEKIRHKFLQTSVKKSTKRTYNKSWKLWEEYVNINYSDLTTPSLSGIKKEVGVDIIISFMHHLVNIGFLGEKFKVTLTGVKQCMLLEGNSCYDYFNDPFCRQASKGCRYPTSRLQTALTEKQNKHQLPLSYDMILSIKKTYWDVSNGCNDPNQRYRCGIFLCLEMGYDAGKRVGNLTHRTSSSEEDHCIRTSHVQFVFSTSTLYRGTPILNAGPEFREFMLKYRPPFTVISKAKLHFHTQKSTAIYVIKPTEALFVGRNTQMESDYLDRLVLWSVWNWNDMGERQGFEQQQ